MKPTMTISEAAAFLGRSTRTVRAWIAAGWLPVVVVSQQTRRVCQEAVEGMREALARGEAAMSFEGAAAVLGLRRETVRKMAASGRLPRIESPAGRVLGVCRASVERLVGEGLDLSREALEAVARRTRRVIRKAIQEPVRE